MPTVSVEAAGTGEKEEQTEKDEVCSSGATGLWQMVGSKVSIITQMAEMKPELPEKARQRRIQRKTLKTLFDTVQLPSVEQLDELLDAADDDSEESADEHQMASAPVLKGAGQALRKEIGARTPEDIDEIFNMIKVIQNSFFARLEDSVKRAVCERLTIQEFKSREMICDYGDVGDRLYLIYSGRVQIEVPSEKPQEGVTPRWVKMAVLEQGKVFGELALMGQENNKRKARCTAKESTTLLTLTAWDYRWCVGFSQESFVRERVTFLKSAERAVLDGIQEVDLQAMAGCLTEETFIGEQEILKQATEVDRVIFVKSGFCKVVRQLHPRHRDQFKVHADTGEKMPNPFADGTDNEGLQVGKKEFFPKRNALISAASGGREKSDRVNPSVSQGGEVLGLGSRQALRKLLRQHQKMEEAHDTSAADEAGEAEAAEPWASSPPDATRPVAPKLLTKAVSISIPDSPRSRSSVDKGSNTPRRGGGFNTPGADSSAACFSGAAGEGEEEPAELVVVDILQAGRSFGIMELMEGLTYQCSVVPFPMAQVYVISKFDFIRNVSKAILHRLFCDCKGRLSDERLMHRLKQKTRWGNYKRELLRDIQNLNSRASKGIIDRRDPPSRGVGVSGLPEEDYARVGRGEKLWDKRAQTPPKKDLLTAQVKQIFHVRCIRDDSGKPKVVVDREQRDASMDALEEKLLSTVATARFRDKLRRKEDGANRGRSSRLVCADEFDSEADGLDTTQSGGRSAPTSPRAGANRILSAQELDIQAKTAAENHFSGKQDRLEAVRRLAQTQAVEQQRLAALGQRRASNAGNVPVPGANPSGRRGSNFGGRRASNFGQKSSVVGGLPAVGPPGGSMSARRQSVQRPPQLGSSGGLAAGATASLKKASQKT